jgi:hypothetical protein
MNECNGIFIVNGMEYLYRDMADHEVMPGRGSRRGRGRGRGVNVMPSTRYPVRRRLGLDTSIGEPTPIETGTRVITPETTGNFI